MEQQAETERGMSLEELKHIHNESFQKLPPLGSDEYLKYVENAPAVDLAPEVLVRAFRQLPPNGPAARATLERLFRRLPDKSWESLGPMISYARREARNRRTEYEDLLNDGLRRILQDLSGDRGLLAECAWNVFCRHELVDAWRERFGRRGERCPPEEQVETSEEDSKDPLDCLDVPIWHVSLRPTKNARIEEVAERGAIGSALLYVLGLTGVTGSVTLLDRDCVDTTNLNRSPLFTAQHAAEGCRKVDAAFDFLRQLGLDAKVAHGTWREKSDSIAGEPFDVWVSLTNEEGTWAEVPYHLPPIVIHGTTTSGWGIGFAHAQCLFSARRVESFSTAT